MMGLCLLLALFIIPSIIHNVFKTTIPTAVLGQNQTTQEAANEDDKTRQGVEQTINGTAEFLGNVSETTAENPVVGNATQETQKFFAEKSK